MNDDQVIVPANITVANRIYLIKVPVDREEYFRKAESLIKTQMSYLNENYNDKDIQDKLSVVVLNIAAELIEYQTQVGVHNAKIEDIDRELGLYLEEQGSLDNIE